ncbi:MAG: hypothetical protein N2C12_05485 [Planctomycetales bacterium]
MNRLFYLIGAAGVVAATLLFYEFGGAIVRVFQVLGYKTNQPLPIALEQTRSVALAAVLLSSGILVACFGVMWSGKHRLNKFGRVTHPFAGIVIITAALIAGWAMFHSQKTLYELATLDSNPSTQDVQGVIAPHLTFIDIAFKVLIAAGVLMAITALVGFSKGTTVKTHFAAWLATVGAMLPCALAFAVLMVLDYNHAMELTELLTNTEINVNSQELAEIMAGTVSKLIAAFLILACLGSVQILAAFLAPFSPPPIQRDMGSQS